MRVIGGKYGRRTLRTLRGRRLRPSSDRLRETLFNILGPEIREALVVDVFAGSGAVGIEALSRGARQVIFIEKNGAAVELIRRNLASLGIREGAEVLSTDAIRGLENVAQRRLLPDLIFLDPPYEKSEEYERLFHFLDDRQLLAPAGWIIAEHSRRSALPDRLYNLVRARVVEQGDAALSFYRLARAA